MSLANKILEFKLTFANGLSSTMETIATKIFNYPNQMGMPINQPYDIKKQAVVDYVSKLPIHETQFPHAAVPKTLSQNFFGNIPNMGSINRTIYEDNAYFCQNTYDSKMEIEEIIQA